MPGPPAPALRRNLRRAGLVALLSLTACGGDEPFTGPGTPVSVLTWNLYLGTDLTKLATVATPAAIPGVAAEMWAHVRATDLEARAALIADRIATLAPNLVALQEVTLYRRQAPSDFQAGGGPNAINVELDFLGLVLKALAARGSSYRVAMEAPNADVELPVDDGAGGLFDLRVTDRDVILTDMNILATDGLQQKFVAKTNFTVGGVGGVPVSFTRSASRVTIQGLGAQFTFANAHLEIEALHAIQTAQAKELVAFLAPVTGPVILAGDFNSARDAAPEMTSYPLLMKSFHDPALALPVPATLPTCCQDEDLKNAASTAGSRIDLVLTRGKVRMDAQQVVGSDPAADKTPGGLWASDHFGVSAQLQIGF